MAWEWSHAPEAYEIAEKNLRKKSINGWRNATLNGYVTTLTRR